MQKKYLPLTLLFVVFLVLLASLGARRTAVPTFTFASTSEKRVYLTFDDGPSTKVTGEILDVLKEEDVKATFFIVSDRVYGREEILRRTVAEGHSVGVHSKSHDYSKIYASSTALIEDATACAQVIAHVTGKYPTLYRFPGGGHEDKASLLTAQGYKIVGWNAVCGDEQIRGATADKLVETAIASSKGKSEVVLLCHDSAYRRETAKALPRIIAHFRAQGYVFCTF